MLTTRHPVDFPYTRQELEALFRYANEHDVEKGGRYDARSAAINLWSHHWQNEATREESETIGSFFFHCAPTPMLYEIETDEGFTFEDLIQELGRLELGALACQAKLGVCVPGASLCGVRPHQPRIPSGAAVQEAKAARRR